jgi:acetyl esterase/lipase
MGHDSSTVLTRPARSPDLVVRYGDEPDHVIDIRWPRSGVGPLVLLVHGGFWRQAYDRAHAGPAAEALAGEGYLVATPEYRRVGGAGGWPATLDDVAAVLKALPGLLGLADRTPVVLAGHSAGGHLALWAAGLTAGPSAVGLVGSGPAAAGPASLTVAGVVGLAPVCDLRRAHELGLGSGAVADLLDGGPDVWPERYLAADPVSRLPLPCRVTLVHGSADAIVPVGLSRHFVTVARSAGSEVDLVELPESDHFDVIDPLSAAWPAVRDAVATISDGHRP